MDECLKFLFHTCTLPGMCVSLHLSFSWGVCPEFCFVFSFLQGCVSEVSLPLFRSDKGVCPKFRFRTSALPGLCVRSFASYFCSTNGTCLRVCTSAQPGVCLRSFAFSLPLYQGCVSEVPLPHLGSTRDASVRSSASALPPWQCFVFLKFHFLPPFF